VFADEPATVRSRMGRRRRPPHGPLAMTLEALVLIAVFAFGVSLGAFLGPRGR
jgi:hypothetical protein